MINRMDSAQQRHLARRERPRSGQDVPARREAERRAARQGAGQPAAASSRRAPPRSSRSSRRSRSRTACSRRSRARSRRWSPPSRRASCRWPQAVQARLAQQHRVSQQQAIDTVVGVSAVAPQEQTIVAPPSTHGGVVGVAMSQLGTPYVWGGAAPGGFDCSGLVMWAYAQVGVSLPHSTYAQYGMGVAGLARPAAARRPRLLRRARPRRHLHRRRAVRARTAHRRRRQDLEPRRGLVLRRPTSAPAASSSGP